MPGETKKNDAINLNKKEKSKLERAEVIVVEPLNCEISSIKPPAERSHSANHYYATSLSMSQNDIRKSGIIWEVSLCGNL